MSTSPAPAPAPAAPKPRPYGRYLTSALHTRFVQATLLTLLNSCILSFITGTDYFWSWFPLGPGGIKTVLFAFSSFFIFVLQLSTIKIGRRTSTSPFTIFRSMVFDLSSYKTLFWYTCSSWLFCEIYIQVAPSTRNMGWVQRQDFDGPDRLNERPIYLRFFFTVMAVLQSGIHIYQGHSYLHIPVISPSNPHSGEQNTHPIQSVQAQLQSVFPEIAAHLLLISSAATVIAPFVYKAFFRDSFWRLHLAIAKLFFNMSRLDAHPPDTYFIGTILAWAFVVGAALSFTWELSAHSLMIYFKQAPLKNGLPLSAGSKDPNGTLLNGLLAKRSVVKTFALWELSLIAQKHPDRRKAIFADFERPHGPIWTSMLKAALSVLADIDSRILEFNPPAPQENKEQEEKEKIKGLPRIVKDPSKQQIVAGFPPPSTRSQKVQEFITMTGARTLGQSSNPWSPPIKETQQKLIEYAKPAIDAGTNELRTNIDYAMDRSLVRNLVGPNPAKRISGVVLGSPVGNAAVFVDAIEAVTKMLVASLNEDDFGKVVQTVPESVKQFSRTIMMIEGYVSANSNALAYTDEPELNEVGVVLSRLKSGLRELLAAFQVFLNDVGLGIKELNDAKRASEERSLLPQKPVSKSIERGPEMEEIVDQRSQPSSASNASSQQPPEDPRDRRARETAQSLRRIEAQPRRRRLSGGGANVFDARDLRSAHSREAGMVR